MEGAIALDLVMHVAETAAEAVDRELRDGPDHLAEKEHHGADVEELEAASFVSALHDIQTSSASLLRLDAVVTSNAGVNRSPEELRDLEVRPFAHVLREVRASGVKNACDLRPPPGDWTPARDEIDGRVRER